jgi:hypothetical protein
MKKLLVLTAYLAVANLVSAQVKVPACPFDCDIIPITHYTKGMSFYFPPGEALEALNKLLPRMRIKRNCDYADISYGRVNYRDVAGKIFVIDSVGSDSVGAFGNGNYRRYQVFLRGQNCREFLRYQIVVDLRQFDEAFMLKGTLIYESYTIDDAVSLDEVYLARNKMVGNSYYLVSADEQKNGQRVEITEVRAGKFHSPLFIFYRFTDNTFDSVYTDVCHLNVPMEGRSNIGFPRFFTCVAPVATRALAFGMTPQQVEAILGKPQKKSQTRTAALTTIEYTYKDQVLTFENGALKKIGSN